MEQDNQKKLFMMAMVDKFKSHVSDAMDDGIHNDFPDHFAFLDACLETFIELEETSL